MRPLRADTAEPFASPFYVVVQRRSQTGQVIAEWAAGRSQYAAKQKLRQLAPKYGRGVNPLTIERRTGGVLAPAQAGRASEDG